MRYKDWTGAKLFKKAMRTRTLREGVVNNLDRKAKLEQATGATALQQLRAHADLAHKRIAAEDAVAIKALGGTLDSAEADPLGDVNIGDHYHSNEPSPFSQMAGKALLAASVAGPLAAVAWKYLDRPPAVEPPAAATAVDTDTVTELKIFRGDTDGN